VGAFAATAWARTEPLRRAIHALPFNTELAAGTLGPEQFRGYVVQDALFLAEYSRVLAIAGAKAPDGASLNLFVQSAVEAVAVEQALHARYFGEFGISASAPAEPSPDCLAYTSFLLATAYQEPWDVLVAALLPCFWLYWDVGSAIVQRSRPDNPYRAWIETYADAAYGEVVKQVIATADRAAAAATPAAQERMLAAFVRSTLYEWLFWDGAYHRRGWPSPG
jgi:thiaminase (transcriptional activator TenA)